MHLGMLRLVTYFYFYFLDVLFFLWPCFYFLGLLAFFITTFVPNMYQVWTRSLLKAHLKSFHDTGLEKHVKKKITTFNKTCKKTHFICIIYCISVLWNETELSYDLLDVEQLCFHAQQCDDIYISFNYKKPFERSSSY